MFDLNFDRLIEVTNTKDRIFTGYNDINGMKIRVGDVITPNGSTEQYYINYSPEKKCFYGLATGNKILKEKDFSKCENIGVAIFNKDAKEIFG